jgi:4-amino-4-deoxy-L-arabinose transferase-like glycosyltransferase
LAGILFAVDWVSIVVTQIITADSLVAPLIALSVLAFAFHLKTGQLWQAIVAGLLLGGSALVKPVAQIVVPIFVISWFFSRPRRRTGLVFLLLYVLVAVPWMLRNQRTYGMFTLSTIGTVDLYFYIAQGAKQDVSILRDPFGRDFQLKLNQLHIKEWESRSYDSELDRKRRMEEESWPIVRQYWPRVLKWGAVGAARVALGVSRTNADWLRAPHPPLPKFWTMVLPTAQVLGMWLFAAFAVLHRRREGGIPKNLKILISGTILALLVAASGPVGYSQYRVPLAPLLCILTACGLVQARQRLRKSVPEPAVAEALAAG